jgi:hypothetical protein
MRKKDDEFICPIDSETLAEVKILKVEQVQVNDEGFIEEDDGLVSFSFDTTSEDGGGKLTMTTPTLGHVFYQDGEKTHCVKMEIKNKVYVDLSNLGTFLEKFVSLFFEFFFFL